MILTEEEKKTFKEEWDTVRAYIKCQNVSRETLAILIVRIYDLLDTKKCCHKILGVSENCDYPTTAECNKCKLGHIKQIIDEVIGNEKTEQN